MGPLDGLTIVEFGQFVVVPFCSQLMADCGARVIKVEPLAGDSYRRGGAKVGDGLTRQFLIKNRGKESIALDLAHREAPSIINALVGSADVVLVNLSPDAIRRRGLDYESLHQINPRIVHAIVSAFGFTGQEATLPGMDVVVQARSGLLTSLAAERDGVPFHSEAQLADYSTSLLLFGAVSAALYARERTGRGQSVETSLLAGALALQNNSLAHMETGDEWRLEHVHALKQLRADGAGAHDVHADRTARRPDRATHTAHYRAFRTQDSFVAIGAGSPASRARLAKVLELLESTAENDPDLFSAQVNDRLATNTSAHWVSVFRAAAVPVAPVHTIDEILLDEHVAEEGLVATYEHPIAGAYRGFGHPIRFGETKMVTPKHAPLLGEHTRAILSHTGFSDSEIRELLRIGAVAEQPNNRKAEAK